MREWLGFGCYFPLFSSFGPSILQWQPNEVLQLIFTSYIMIFFFFFSLFSAPSGTKGKTLFHHSSHPRTHESCMPPWSCAFERHSLTSEMVFLLGLQEPEVGQEQKHPQTWLSTSPLPTESHQKTFGGQWFGDESMLDHSAKNSQIIAEE